MSRYRRIRRSGGTFFFTLRVQARGTALLTERIEALRAAYAASVAEAPVRCEAIVVLPDHLHAVWTLPEGDSAYSERWRRMKARFTREVGARSAPSASKRAKREGGLWQRRFWEHTIRDAEDFRRHVAYCWMDPVRHGLAARASDWPNSSIHREIRNGIVRPDWSAPTEPGRYGE